MFTVRSASGSNYSFTIAVAVPICGRGDDLVNSVQSPVTDHPPVGGHIWEVTWLPCQRITGDKVAATEA